MAINSWRQKLESVLAYNTMSQSYDKTQSLNNTMFGVPMKNSLVNKVWEPQQDPVYIQIQCYHEVCYNGPVLYYKISDFTNNF